MKVLLTGSTGQVGQAILKAKPKGVEIISPDRKILDLSDYESCKNYVKENKPNWIINSGAYTAVDDAEKNIRLSRNINSYAPKAFTEIVNEINANLLQLSTDFVFDGNQNYPYKTNQKRNPLNQYGASKALGENLIENNIINPEKAIILRTSWVISPIGKNFVLTMLNLHSKKDHINVVCDQIGSPSSSFDLAKVCWKIIEYGDKKSLPHILHWSDAGIASWYDIAVAIGDIAKELNIIKRKAIVNPISTNEYPTPAKRPKYSKLDTTETFKLLKLKPNHWRENLKNILIEYKNINLI